MSHSAPFDEKRPVPVRAVPVKLKRKDTVDEALARLLSSCLRQARSNVGPILANDDIEGVHQMRVGVRRFRAVLSAFRTYLPKNVRREAEERLSDISALLGSARDWDVFRFHQVAEMQSGFSDSGDYSRLLERVEAIRQARYGQVLTRLKDPEFEHTLEAMAEWSAQKGWHAEMSKNAISRLQRPVIEAAPAILANNHKQVRRPGAQLDRMTDEALHALRIEVKKLRYAVEFFASLYGAKRVARYRDATRDLQEHLGRMNDAFTMRGPILEELREAGVGPGTLGFLAGWCQGARHQACMALPSAWAEFKRQKKFWES